MTLSEISDILADTGRLEKSYGIRIEQKPVVSRTSLLASSTSILNHKSSGSRRTEA